MRIDNAGKKITGMVAGVATGESARYDEVVNKLNKTGDTLVSALVQDERLVAFDKGTVSGGTVNFNTADGNIQRVQVGGALSFAFTWPASGDSAILVRVVNGGAYSVSISGVLFIASDGTTQPAPNASFQASGTDLVLFMRLGGIVYGKVIR